MQYISVGRPGPSPVSTEPAILRGEISPWPGRDALEHALSRAGLSFLAGRYSIRIDCCEHFVLQTLEIVPTIDAQAATTDRLVDDATRVSFALRDADIRHRFEIRDGAERFVANLHHRWPPALEVGRAALAYCVARWDWESSILLGISIDEARSLLRSPAGHVDERGRSALAQALNEVLHGARAVPRMQVEHELGVSYASAVEALAEIGSPT